MDETASRRKAWEDYFLPRAESGDPAAQLEVGIAFGTGKYLPKDLLQSEKLLRKASERVGEKALFMWMKILVTSRDPSAHDLFAEKDEWKLGAIYYMYGYYLASEFRVKEAMPILRTGMIKGNIFSEIHYYRNKYKWPLRAVFIPRLIILSAKVFAISLDNKDDERILH